MNKFRKFLIGIVVAAGAACLGGAVACADTGASGQGGEEPVYYQLDLDGRGFDIVFEGDLAELNEDGENFQFSGKVKEGVDVRFKVQLGSDTVGTPSVKVNGAELTPDSDGVYSFTMSQKSEISVTGLNTLYTLKLIKVKETENEDGEIKREERRIKFYDETGKRELGDEVRIEGGEDFTFALWTSPYYEDTFTVKCGYEEIEREGYVQGKNLKLYTVHGVSSDGEIDVIELEQKLSFANHNDPATYGDGSEANPYKISDAIDLFYMAALINSEFDGSTFSSLYYEMTADIDMDGEQLYVIGDGSNSSALFNGHFNGNGHTISNFRITDEVFDQESFSAEYLPYVGLFGYASAYIDSNLAIHPATIENLTLKDFTISAHPAAASYSATVGSLVGFGVGVEITGCRAEGGDLFVENDDNQIVVMGGLVGRLQGAYGATSAGIVTANAFVRSSSVDMSVEGSGSPRSAGGIVGYLVSADETAIAYVINSYSEGSVNGAMHSGGIVGTLGRFSSVGGSYSAAQVSASNYFDGLNVSPDFMGAYAGGIAGYAEESTVIWGCYAANYTSASVNVITAEGANQTSTGAFAGGFAVANAKSADLANLIEYNNSKAVANHPESVFAGLGWSDADWDYANGLPRVKISDTERKITISAQQANTQSKKQTELTGMNTMSYWYANGLDEYVTGTGAQGISWGYYFDEELTRKVPYGFVPFAAETLLYIDYADYGEVAGTYYFEDTEYSNGAYITLTADGKAEFRNGGLYHVCKYTYDDVNNRIVIYRSALAALSFSETQIDGGYFAYGGTMGANGVLSLEAYVTVLNASGSAEAGTQYVSEEAALRAVKATDFAYGEYRDNNGVTYLFRKNGTGIMTDNGTTKAFTFTPAGETFKITLERTGAEVTGRQIDVTVTNGEVGTIDDVTVQLKDNFKGSWQVNANAFTVFTFDGIDTVTMSVIGQSPKEVGYTRVRDNEISFTIDEKLYKATFTDGNVVIEGETYCVSDGLTGEWFMVSGDEWIEISLEGTGAEGYGNAVITYAGGASQSYGAQYDVVNAANGTYLRVYIGDTQYGELSYNAAERSVNGTFYSLTRNRYESFKFYLYDAIRGVWTGVSDEFDSVTFNGRSASAEDSKVDVTAVGNSVKRGTYTLNGATGTMTVNGVSYTISYSEKDNKVTVTTVGGTSESQQLAPRDEWYQVKLYDGETVYEFDGKSNVNGSGSVKVREGGEVTDTLAYTVEGGTVKIAGTALVPDGNGYQWNSKTLKFRSGFAGEWIVSGTDKLLTIEEVSGYLTATATCTGVSGNYGLIYSPSANTLTITEGVTVTVIKLMGNDEMSIIRTTGESSISYNCAKTADAYKGSYTGEDGTWLLDGLGSCRYGSGTAVFTPTSGEPVKYTYKINRLGLPYIRATENVLFVKAEADESGYSKDGETYKTVVVNAYYDRTVYDFDTRTEYYFDGISTLWVKANDGYTAVYTYEIINGAYCEFIDADGVRWNGKMEQPVSTIWLTVSEQIKATAGEGGQAVTYAFGVTTLWQVNSDGSYTKAYSFASTDEEGVYELTDGEGKKYTATLTEGNNGNKLEITPVAGTTEQA